MLINGVKYLEVSFGNAFAKSSLIKSMKSDKAITFLLNTENNTVVPAKLDEYNDCHLVVKYDSEVGEHHYYGTVAYISEVAMTADFKAIKRAYVKGREIFWKERIDLILGLRSKPGKQLPVHVMFKIPTITLPVHHEFNDLEAAIEWLAQWNWLKGDILEVRRGTDVVVFYTTFVDLVNRLNVVFGE